MTWSIMVPFGRGCHGGMHEEDTGTDVSKPPDLHIFQARKCPVGPVQHRAPSSFNPWMGEKSLGAPGYGTGKFSECTGTDKTQDINITFCSQRYK